MSASEMVGLRNLLEECKHTLEMGRGLKILWNQEKLAEEGPDHLSAMLDNARVHDQEGTPPCAVLSLHSATTTIPASLHDSCNTLLTHLSGPGTLPMGLGQTENEKSPEPDDDTNSTAWAIDHFSSPHRPLQPTKLPAACCCDLKKSCSLLKLSCHARMAYSFGLIHGPGLDRRYGSGFCVVLEIPTC